MPKKKSLDSQLLKWLEGHGYPFEMEVAQEFRDHGFRVGQGSYYEDPNTKEPREIDVVASQADIIDDLQVFLTCFVSCKRSRDKPWVLFTTERTPIGASSDFYSMVASNLGMQLLFNLKHAQEDPLPLLLTPRERLAYGVTVGLREPKAFDVAYDAVMTAAKAAVSRAATINSEFEPNEMIVEVVVPTVLIDGALFEYYLDNTGEKHLSQTHWGLLSLGTPIPGRKQSTLVNVVTKEGLPDFVKSLDEVFKLLKTGSKEYYDKLVQSWASKRKGPSITFLPFKPPV